MALTPDELERYKRHILLKEIGGPGQARLRDAHVTLVGMGGIGGPAALYLAAAGVGWLTLIDADTVALSNLQRQIQFATSDLGAAKVAVAKRRLGGLNPGTHIDAVEATATATTVQALLKGADLVIDGTDDFDVRFAVNDACLALGVPLVSAALGPWSGQLGVFGARTSDGERGPCYRCFVSDAPDGVETCQTLGVVGALAGVVGSMAALEAIKIIARAGAPLIGRLWLFDALKGEARTVALPRDPKCPACGEAGGDVNDR